MLNKNNWWVISYQKFNYAFLKKRTTQQTFIQSWYLPGGLDKEQTKLVGIWQQEPELYHLVGCKWAVFVTA